MRSPDLMSLPPNPRTGSRADGSRNSTYRVSFRPGVDRVSVMPAALLLPDQDDQGAHQPHQDRDGDAPASDQPRADWPADAPAGDQQAGQLQPPGEYVPINPRFTDFPRVIRSFYVDLATGLWYLLVDMVRKEPGMQYVTGDTWLNFGDTTDGCAHSLDPTRLEPPSRFMWRLRWGNTTLHRCLYQSDPEVHHGRCFQLGTLAHNYIRGLTLRGWPLRPRHIWCNVDGSIYSPFDCFMRAYLSANTPMLELMMHDMRCIFGRTVLEMVTPEPEFIFEQFFILENLPQRTVTEILIARQILRKWRQKFSEEQKNTMLVTLKLGASVLRIRNVRQGNLGQDSE